DQMHDLGFEPLGIVNIRHRLFFLPVPGAPDSHLVFHAQEAPWFASVGRPWGPETKGHDLVNFITCFEDAKNIETLHFYERSDPLSTEEELAAKAIRLGESLTKHRLAVEKAHLSGRKLAKHENLNDYEQYVRRNRLTWKGRSILLVFLVVQILFIGLGAW